MAAQGNLDGAIWNMRKAVRLSKELKNKMFLTQLLLESGLQGNIEDARAITKELIEEKAEIVKRDRQSDEFQTYNVIKDLANLQADENAPESTDDMSVARVEALYMQLVKADLMLRDYRGADRHISQWLDLNQRSAAALYSRAKVYSHLGNYEEAMKALEKSLDENPRRPESQYMRAYLLEKHGKSDEALEVCQKVVRILRRDQSQASRVPNLHLLMGKLYEKKQEYKKAEHSYSLLIKYDPSRPMPHYRRANALLNGGSEGKANHEFGEVLKLWADACVPNKNCKNYFYQNKAAKAALEFIGTRCQGVDCSAAKTKKAAAAPVVPAGAGSASEAGGKVGSGSGDVPLLPAKPKHGEAMDIKEMCRLYVELKAAD